MAYLKIYDLADKLDVSIATISPAMNPEKGVQAHFVSGDHFQGGRLAAQHLYSLGHRKVAILTGPPDSTDSKLRAQGFQAYWTEFGLKGDPRLIVCGDFQEEKGAAVVEALFRGKRPEITAIFACNDNRAFGAIRKLKEMGLSCPKDISVIGYDDDKRCEIFDPQLTSIRVPALMRSPRRRQKSARNISRTRIRKNSFTFIRTRSFPFNSSSASPQGGFRHDQRCRLFFAR